MSYQLKVSDSNVVANLHKTDPGLFIEWAGMAKSGDL